MDTDKLRELQIATKRAKYEWQNKVASGKPAGMAAENYQMHLMRAKGEMSPEEYKTFLGRLN